ncbi:N-acetylmuramoyl-L-alanine amidase [Kaistia dalseonensis]|uniref:N-acetylmuramoyl-L-alanine amidase n=1 Tax=Kaistia dalseonensis TaxID=410840 RepID=A0ABU0H161_9HYPH|nr:N-acetylmuramoyl-L-alanine amidase [Kaistia dalseonensis]MCX5493494.1 N-acetylmuramoyl-L-alanine amidase [Kaistia dalseonensis]MDQ0436054.1 N-acetylmuramoyl-L-alanine amidase [Kaistia dalseonensis]
MAFRAVAALALLIAAPWDGGTAAHAEETAPATTEAAAPADTSAETLPATPPAAMTMPPAPQNVTASEARVVGDGARTRFVMDLSDATALTVFPLDKPDRVVVDLPEVHFTLPADAGKTGKGLVSAFRYGMISAGKSRIVLDATEPVSVDKAFVLPPADGQPAKLVIDLVPSTRAKFTEAVRQYRDRDQQTVAAPPAEAPAIPAPEDGKLRIVLDPGHGGIDSGAIGKSGTLEKDVVLAFALTLKQKLEASGHYEVMMTRADDTFIPLGGRVVFARARHADLFISIHADSFWGSDIRGATVYTLSEKASDQMAAQIAESENKSDILAGVDVPEDTNEVSDILIDLARRETKNFAVVFARNMIKELKPDVRLFKHAHQQAGFMVLKAPDVPSALVELGYLSNAEDEKLLTSDDWRDKTAIAINRAVDDYFRMRVAQSTTGSITAGVAEP